MRQLTGLDMQFLALESPRQAGHVGGLAILDPSTRPDGKLDATIVQAMITERLPLLPPFRWRLKTVPFGLDYPYWIDDAGFDVEYHVRELALPAPGSHDQLAEQVARIFSRPLDRARPLWELYVIHGLPDGCVAMLTKIHHAAVDGMSGAEIMGVLLDLSPEGRELPPAEPEGLPVDREPGTADMLLRAALGAPRYLERVVRALPKTLPNLAHAPIINTVPGVPELGQLSARLARALQGEERRVLERSNLTPPRTSFNGQLSPHRRFAFGQLPLEEVKQVKNDQGVTVNDVVVAICAGAVRRWLVEHRELPADPLVAQVPVSVRTDQQRGTFGNRIGMMSVPLFTNEADPLRRLQLTHEALAAAKDTHRALPAGLLQDATQFIPPAVFARAARITFSLAAVRRPIWNLVVSNVPGPQFPLYCAGARLVANYPVSVITDGMGLNITVMSYCGHLDFGIVADRDQMRDVAELIGWLRLSLDELLERAPAVDGTGGSAPAEPPRESASADGTGGSAPAEPPRESASADGTGGSAPAEPPRESASADSPTRLARSRSAGS